MRINHNISSMIAQGSIAGVNRSMSTSLHRLSTGLRINSAADDAAGLGVSETLRTQVRGMGQAMRNTQDAIALLNIADGALNEQAEILQRMRELVIQAKNETYTQTERDYMGIEFNALMQELDRIAETTKYNKMQIFATPASSGNNLNGVYLDSSAETDPLTANKTRRARDVNDGPIGDTDRASGHHFNMMIGANYSQEDMDAFAEATNHYGAGAANMLTISFGQMDSNALFHMAPINAMGEFGLDGMGYFGDFSWDPETSFGDMSIEFALGGEATVVDKLNIMLKVIDGGKDLSDAEKQLLFVESTDSPTGLDRVNRMRSYIGAMTNRLEHTLNNLVSQTNNTQAAESLIRDADFAAETATFTRNQILTQSSTAMLAQANSVPQMVLSLLG
ncbi:Flagellin protein FlaA [Chitinispirillum alkaliphilum]|nr:Flagellin protein FlaA [Chitinispirillum alkaliphilum]